MDEKEKGIKKTEQKSILYCMVRCKDMEVELVCLVSFSLEINKIFQPEAKGRPWHQGFHCGSKMPMSPLKR